MPRRSSIETLPAELKAWLDGALVAGGFADYRELAAELTARGYPRSKSAVHRYGEKFEERIAQLKVATEQARAIVTASPDDEGAMADALMRLVQERMFTVLRELEVDPAEHTLNLPKAARAIADLARASVTQKKWVSEVREKTRAAAESVEQLAAKGGLSADAVQAIRREILGIAA